MRACDGSARRAGRGPVVWVMAIVCSAGALGASAAVFDDRGFNRNRDYFTQLPFEHIDPMTGNLLLTHTDLVLPGNAGFDLKVQRTYNSKIYRDYNTGQVALDEDSWAGVGWTLHFGRVFNSTSTSTANPVVEMPDGSRHPTFHKIGTTSDFITREYWLYNRNTSTLKLPNGVVYTFGRGTTIGSATVAYATKIEDPFGNTVTINYATDAVDVITSVVQDLSGEGTRTITFTRESTWNNLRTMTYTGSQGHTWTYTHESAGSLGYSLLVEAQPPVGQSWRYQYNTTTNPKWELVGVTTPQGGQTNYTYAEFQSRLGSQATQRFHGVTRRTISGRDVAPGTWNYAYAQGAARNQSTIAGPCRTETQTFIGVGNDTPGNVWEIGLLGSRTISDASGVLQTEDLDWIRGEAISSEQQIVGFNVDSAIYVPLLSRRTLTRNGRSYVTNNSYRTTNFNDFGRPWQIAEDGDLHRVTTREFDYGFGVGYLIDRIKSETVSMGGESFTKDYDYNHDNGFLTDETIYGIPKHYSATASGNIASITDANGHTVSFSNYLWGSARTIATPEFTFTRGIHPEGLLASETRRGFQTTFDYDALFRPTRIHPPAGANDTVTSYDTSGDMESFVVSRGPSSTTTTVDGFGRPSATLNAVGVQTDIDYDACGRKTYESYPFTAANIGVTSTFDGLDRILTKTNPDGTQVRYLYANAGNGINTSITNERNKTTIQKWQAFGDPADARLGTVTDMDGKLWDYDYNALGSLTRVTAPGGVVRQWSYFANGLLQSERHPELQGQPITYTNYANGLMRTRTDPEFGTTSYGYDGNDRLASVDRPGAAYDTTMTYDDSDNRTLLQNSYVRSSFGYDGANRLTSRSDVFGGRTFTTGYLPDGNDNVLRINYQSGLSVSYSYDDANRPTSAIRTGAPCPGPNCFARDVLYHPSGAVTSFVAGNNQIHSMTYDAQRYWLRSVNAGGLLNLNYTTYDGVGNVVDIDDSRAGFDQHYGYDNLDRMTIANGVWGAGGFGYDALGNRTSHSLPGCTTNYGYSSERLTNATGCRPDSFGYDANGNLRAQNGRSYTYTPENMMETAVVGSDTATYRYDGDNLRKIRDLNGARSLYVHGPGGQLLSEYSEPCPGQLTRARDYVYLGTRLLAAVRPATPPPTVALTAAAVSVNEATGSVRLDVRLQTGDGQPTVCPVTVRYATADGTATAADYTPPPAGAALTFPAGAPHNSIQSATVVLNNDALDEDTETFTFNLISATGATLGSPASSTISIVDDDPTPGVSTSDVTVSEGALGSQTPATFNVGLSAVSGRDVTVEFTTADLTAIAGRDYVAVAHTSPPVTIPAGTQSVPVPVMVLGDATDENDEQFSVRLANAVNATITGGGVWRGTIVDDDLPPTISVADCTRVEGNTGSVPCAFVVSLSNPSAFPIGVSYATADGTAVAGSDYTQTSGTLSFPLETATTTAPVSILGDTSSEPSETFLVNLSAPTGGAIGDGQAVGTIIDDEAMKFYPVTPCRVLDTRVLGGPVQAGQKRTFPVATQTCPLPATAKAVIVNVTATQETKSGNLRLYPAGLAAPMTSVLNFAEGVARANNATVLVGASGQLTVQCDMAAAGSTQVIVDVFGYYE